MSDLLENASGVEPFWDQHELKVDSKGRINTPLADRAKFQGEPGGFFVQMDDHIAIMRPETWRAYFNKFKADDSISQKTLSLLSSRASTFKLDPQGRMSISQKLRNRAGISDSILWVGADTHVALYAPEVWEAVEEENWRENSALARKMKATRVP